MSKLTDQNYLKNRQYKDASNLNTRVDIHRRFSVNPYGWHPWVFDALATLPEQARVLELGCGPAHLWTTNAARIPAGWEITLSDLSDGMLDTARHNLSGIPHSFEFRQMDAQSIPFDDERFDAVIANHMLYHVPDRPKALAEIRRVLKTDGRLIATTVGDHHMDELNIWLGRVNGNLDFALLPVQFTLESGLAQLQPFFSRVEIRRYEDHLQITEIEPLIAYIRSSLRGMELSDTALAQLRSDLEHEIQTQGAVFIGKDSGLFEAWK